MVNKVGMDPAPDHRHEDPTQHGSPALWSAGHELTDPPLAVILLGMHADIRSFLADLQRRWRRKS